jgi:hypothetical protein
MTENKPVSVKEIAIKILGIVRNPDTIQKYQIQICADKLLDFQSSAYAQTIEDAILEAEKQQAKAGKKGLQTNALDIIEAIRALAKKP